MVFTGAQSNPVRSAYDIAKAGGRHGRWLLEQRALGVRQLESGIQSIMRQVKLHEAWIADAGSKVQDWDDRDPRYQAGLLRKWQQDIERQQEQIAIMKGVLHEKEAEGG